MLSRLPLFAILFALLFALYQFLVYPPLSIIDFYSLFSEGIIALIVLSFLFNLSSLQDNWRIYRLLSLGFTLLFISLWTDTLDELVEPAAWVTTLFEDLGELVGFILVTLGMRSWIRYSDLQNRELRRYATTDDLTGLFIRRYFNQKAKAAFRRCRRNTDQFAILLLDVDHFKSINDRYGHACGDQVLQLYARNLQSQLREGDVVARWGGEEFIVLLAESSAEAALTVAEKLRCQAELISVPAGDEQVSFTISVGGTVMQSRDQSLDQIICRADQLLYEAKRQGRNRVCVDFTPCC